MSLCLCVVCGYVCIYRSYWAFMLEVLWIYVCECECVCVYARARICTYVFIVCVCVFNSVCVFVCVYMIHATVPVQ